MTFHWQNGWHFERLPDGSVHVTIRKPDGTFRENDIIPCAEWESIIRMMGAEPGGAWAQEQAVTLHEGRPSGAYLCPPNEDDLEWAVRWAANEAWEQRWQQRNNRDPDKQLHASVAVTNLERIVPALHELSRLRHTAATGANPVAPGDVSKEKLALRERLRLEGSGLEHRPVAETGALDVPERMELEAFRDEAGHWEEVNGDLIALLDAKIAREQRSTVATGSYLASFTIAEVKELRRGLLAACPDSKRGRRAPSGEPEGGV